MTKSSRCLDKLTIPGYNHNIIMPEENFRPLNTLSVEDTFRLFDTGKSGLAEDEAQKRNKIHGPNELVKKEQTNSLILFLTKFLNPLILVLLLASFISAFLGQKTDFVIIAAMIFLSVFIDFYQERNAGQAVARLRQRISLRANVIRDGRKQEIQAKYLVPGDVIFLSIGDVVPADGRLIFIRDLLIDQAVLTGESYPQEKQVRTPGTGYTPVSGRTNMIYSGSVVVAGEGEAVITSIGRQTEYGRLAGKLPQSKPPTAFQTGISKFSLLLLKITLLMVLSVFLANAFIRHDILNSFLFALALAVGLTPELLPLVITINLSRAAVKMAEKKVIVRHLPAIENLGSMNIFCTDKTGTLTEGIVKLERYENVLGEEDGEVLFYGYLNSYFQAGFQNPMEQAIAAHKEINTDGWQKLDEIPFDFYRRRLSVAASCGNRKLLIVKGSYESLISLCDRCYLHGRYLIFDKSLRENLGARFTALSAEGFRILGLAVKTITAEKITLKDEADLAFVGLMAFYDPPKESSRSALNRLSQYGVEIKILTGDNPVVTEKICRSLNITVKGVLTSRDLKIISPGALPAAIINNTVFAGLDPLEKQNIILTLKKAGNTIGYLGDGINDAPSLKEADAGVSVENAVDVARESADIVLLRKDLHVLIDGILEGRKTYGNVMKYIMMGSSSNFGNMASVALASFFLPFIPMLPVQILLNNLLYDLSQLTLSGDAVDSEFIKLPKKWDINFIKRFMLVFGPISSLFDFLTFGFLLYFLKAPQALFQTGWFMESLITQTLIMFVIRTRKIPFYLSRPGRMLLVSSFLVILIALALPQTQLAFYFSFVPAPAVFYPFLAGVVIIYVFIVERAKKWFYKNSISVLTEIDKKR